MKRLHVHVAVGNLANGIKFYSGLFATEPSVVKPDYAKWMLEDPRVNFAISQRGFDAGLNHLGIQVESADELAEMEGRLAQLQTQVVEHPNASCCYAKSDKYWVRDPSGIAWETFHTLDSIPVYGKHAASSDKPAATSACCVPPVASQAKPATSCCGSASAEKSKACC